jgi:hypothetical protein
MIVCDEKTEGKTQNSGRGCAADHCGIRGSRVAVIEGEADASAEDQAES